MGEIYTERYMDSQRSSGYRNTAMALAELVDNSFDANSTNVQIIFIEKKKKGRLRVDEIYVIDNGIGMSGKVVENCLGFGASGDNEAHVKNKKRIGKYGVGLSQASQSQCQRFEVFSWQDGKSYHQYFDRNCEKFRESRRVNQWNPAQEIDIPSEMKEFILDYDQKSGTAIRWSNCDLLSHVTSEANIRHCEQILGQVYRYKIESGECKISFTTLTRNENEQLVEQGSSTEPLAFDPLFLMQNTSTSRKLISESKTAENLKVREHYQNYITSENECMPTSELLKEHTTTSTFNWGDKEIKYSFKTSVATLDIMKPGVRNGGEQPIGKIYEKKINSGNICFVRSGREIESGTFGQFYKISVPENRFWTIEIEFDNKADKIMGLANNKGSYNFHQTLTSKGYDQYDATIAEAKGELHYQISNQIMAASKAALKRIKEINSGWEQKNLISTAEEDGAGLGQTPETGDAIHIDPKGRRVDALDDEEEKELYNLIKGKHPNASDDSIWKRIKHIDDTGTRTYIMYNTIPHSEQLWVYDKIGLGHLHLITINIGHPMYSEVLNPLQKSTSNQSKSVINILSSFEILISAAVVEEEAMVQSETDKKIIERYRSSVGTRIGYFVQALFAAYPNIHDEIEDMDSV